MWKTDEVIDVVTEALLIQFREDDSDEDECTPNRKYSPEQNDECQLLDTMLKAFKQNMLNVSIRCS